MPFYYSVQRSATTNGTGNTCSNHLRLLTIANQANCSVVQVMAAIRNSTTAGSGVLQIVRQGVGGANLTGGTSITPDEMNPRGSAAETTAATDATAFTGYGATASRVVAGVIGYAQTGGQGGWVALERDNAFTLNPNGGANGNLEFDSFTATASQALEVSAQFLEG